jgi:hypothetical protein
VALALEVDELLQDLVGGRDDAGVRLQAALRDDEVGELLREVDVRHLEDADGEHAAAVRSRDAGGGALDDRAAVDGGAQQRPADLGQAGRVGEGGELDLAEQLDAGAVGLDAVTLPSGAMVNDSYSPFGGTVIGLSSMPSTRPPAGVVSWPRASRLKLPARV